MIFQITEDGENIGLIKDVKCHYPDKFSPGEYGEIIAKSVILFKEIGEDEGWDIDDLDDFVEFHNLRSVLIIGRIFIEDEIDFKG